MSKSTSQIVIDGHRHIICPEAQKMAMKLDSIKATDFLDGANEFSAAVNKDRAPAWNLKMTNLGEHFKDLGASGIDVGVLWPPPIGFYYWAEPKAGAELARLINEHTSHTVSQNPDHFVGLATVPLQDGELAAQELSYAIHKLGLKGAVIASNVNGRGLDEEQFYPFFGQVEKLRIPVFIHPHNAAGADRLQNYYLINFIGYPVDSTIAAAQLVFGGVLDRFPDLKICLAHAGGVFPFLLGRFDHGWSVRPEAQKLCKNPVSYYLKNFYVDSITFRPETLRFVLEIMPEGHVFLGTDYPFDMGDPDPVRFLKSAITDQHLMEEVLGENLRRLLVLSDSIFS